MALAQIAQCRCGLMVPFFFDPEFFFLPESESSVSLMLPHHHLVDLPGNFKPLIGKLEREFFHSVGATT